MSVLLLHRSGSHAGQEEKFDREVIRLGRKPENDLVFSESVVSSHHAEIRREGAGYLLLDLESTNGTFVNGRRVRKAALEDGDKIEIGKEGPLMEFRSLQEHSHPQLVPLSGSWEGGNDPVDLRRGQIRLGRGSDNDIVVGREQGSVVSTEHAEIRLESDSCLLEDLNSTNGTFVNGERVRTARLQDGDQVRLGKQGPVFELRWKGQARKSRPNAESSSAAMLRKLERASKGGPAGERTMMFLQAAKEYHKRRRGPLLIVTVLILVCAVVLAVNWQIQKRKVEELKKLAEAVFYQMRSVEADLVRQRDSMSADQFQSLRDRRRKLESDYDQYLEKLGLYEGRNEKEKAVMRMARRLGETDLNVPPDFYKTAMDYVEKWRSTPRLRTAIDRAKQRNLPQKIKLALDQFGLPKEFFFLPLQESGYDATRVGPPTNFGIAKGMWQFIPATATEYGLALGPLKDVPQYDPSDQRHDEDRSTHAAASYLAFLYSTKAAASGLLVIASYNYGQARIIRKLDELPNDPRQRSFWNFYRSGWVPPETRDYVMYIFSAALICEKPHLFDVAMEPVL